MTYNIECDETCSELEEEDFDLGFNNLNLDELSDWEKWTLLQTNPNKNKLYSSGYFYNIHNINKNNKKMSKNTKISLK